MALRRRTDKRRFAVPEAVFRAFLDEDVPITEPGMVEFRYLNSGGFVARWWEAARQDVLDEWIVAHPGTRPLHWWKLDAISQRRRTGGQGKPLHEITKCAEPLFERGLPRYWPSHEYPPYARYAPDPRDPPRYESEAAYLRRLNLFQNGEARRLRPSDYADVTVHGREG